MTSMKRILASVFLCLLLATPAEAGFDEGKAAYDSKDYATALREFRPLAEQGLANAQYNLGLMYDKGRGVAQDIAAAAQWFSKAATQGHGAAQSLLGFMYRTGQGVAQDYAEAVKWYRKAAEQGLTNAQYNLGLLYAEGQGVVQDYVQAHMWWNIAASKGNKSALKGRDIVAKSMTPAQIAEAQRMARDWVAAFNKRKGK
jgi:TPR repeat protein